MQFPDTGFTYHDTALNLKLIIQALWFVAHSHLFFYSFYPFDTHEPLSWEDKIPNSLAYLIKEDGIMEMTGIKDRDLGSLSEVHIRSIFLEKLGK